MNKPLTIAVLDDYLDVASDLADWESLDANVTFLHEAIDPQELGARLAGFDVLVAMRERTRLPGELLTRLKRLKLIVTTGARNAAIDMQMCRERGIDVCYAPGSELGNQGTSELAWALLMGLSKDIVGQTINLREGLWQTYMPPVLARKRLGVVGLGKQGTRVAAYGKAFDMEVVAWSPNLTQERAAAVGVAAVSKDELFATSDYVSLHLVLGETTRSVVDAQTLARMKATAFLINTARAGLVDQAALKAALRTGQIAGAGLDVFAHEPMQADDDWRTLPNVIMTPHLGYANRENFEAYFPNVVEAIAAWQRGEPVRLATA